MPPRPPTRRAYPWWVNLLLAGLLAGLAWLTAGLVLRPVTAGFVPVAVHSHLLADYSADPQALPIPAIDVRILEDVRRDQPGAPAGETPTPVEALLQAPVPTVTLAPGQPTFSPAPPTATSSLMPATETAPPTPTPPPPTPTDTPVLPSETPIRAVTRTPVATLPPVIRPTLSAPTATATWPADVRPSETATAPERPPLETDTPAPPEAPTDAPTAAPPEATETRPPPPPTDTPEPYQPPPAYP